MKYGVFLQIFPSTNPMNPIITRNLDLDLHLHPSQRTGTTWHDVFFWRRWCFHGVKYQITLVNWLNYSQSVTKAVTAVDQGVTDWGLGTVRDDYGLANGSCIDVKDNYLGKFHHDLTVLPHWKSWLVFGE